MSTRTITFLIEGKNNLSAAVNAAKNSLNSLRGVPSKINAMQKSLANAQNLQKLIGDYRGLQRAIQATQNSRAQELLKASRNLSAQAQATKQLEKMRDAYKNLQKYQRGERASLDVDKASVARLKSALQLNANSMGQDAAKIMRQQIQAAEREIKSREKSLNQIMNGAKLDLRAQEAAIKNFGASFNTANSKAQQLQAKLAQLTANSQQLKASLSAQGLGGGTLAAHEMRLRAEIGQTIAAINRETEALNRRNAAAQKFSQAQQDMANAWSNFQNAQQTAQTIMNPFVDATKTAMDFEREMSKVKALTQMRNIRAGNLQAVESEMRQLTELAERLGATTEFTQSEAAQGMQKYAMAGWTSEQIQAIMQATVDFASIAGDHNLMRTADVLSDDLTAFGLKAGQAYKLSSGKVVEASKYFTDAVAYAITQANLDREFFHESWKYNAPVAHAMNLSLGEAIAQNMVLANAGIKGSMSGTSLRQFWVRLSAPPKTAQKSLEEMGMLASDATKKIIETQEALREAGADPNSDLFDKIAALENYYQAGKAAGRDMTGWLKQLTGQTALSGIMSLFDLGKLDEARRYKMEIDTGFVEGWTAETAAITRDNTLTQIEYLKSAWEALQNSIGKAFLGGTTGVAQGLTDLINKLNEFVKENQTAVQYAGLLAAALATVVVVGAGLAAVSAAIGVISSGLALLAPVVTAVGAAFAFLSSPIFLAVGAVVAFIAVVAVLINHADQIKQAFSDAFNHPRGAVIGFCELVKSAISGAVDFAMAQWLTLKSALEHPIEAAINFAKTGSVVGGNVVNGAERVKKLPASSYQLPATSYQLPTYQPYNLFADRTGGAFQVQNAQIQAAQVDLPKVETPQPQLEANSYQLTAELQSSFDAASFATQNLSMNLMSASPATQALAFSAQSAAQSSDALSFATQSASAGANALGSSSQMATGGIYAMSSSAAASTGSISSMAGASSSAAGSISGLGAAASSAIGALMSAGASAAAAVHGAIGAAMSSAINAGHASVAQNAAGGIYNRGSFLTTFAESSPEAAIPIDSSARAKNLWLETGNLLGMFDTNQLAANSSQLNITVNMNFSGERPQDNSWIDDVRQTFAELAEEYFSNRRRVSYV